MSRVPTADDLRTYNGSLSGLPAAAIIPNVMAADGRTERANGLRFASQHAAAVRYVRQWCRWLAWDGKRWKLDAQTEVERLAKETSDHLWDDAKLVLRECESGTQNAILAFVRATASERGIQAMLTMARSEPGIVIDADKLDSDPWLLNVENGTLDVRTGDLRPHNPGDLLTKLAPVRFDRKADCPKWIQFIKDVTAGDRELCDYLRRNAGYVLTGDVRDHVLLFLYGVGSNGKSVFTNTLTMLLGTDYSMKAAPELIMSKGNESHPTERADLFGMRLCLCNEVEAGRRLNESLVKDLSGGDRIRARRMRENFFEFSPTHKTWLAGNHKPTVRGRDNGIWRRLRLVPFTVVIPPEKQDKTLPTKLLGELPGILNWCLWGCKEWLANGLGEPAAVVEATSGYKDEQDVIAQFVGERCVEETGCKVRSKDLYACYSEWCKDGGEHPVNGRRFGEAMSERGHARFKNNGVWYQGIGILDNGTNGTNGT